MNSESKFIYNSLKDSFSDKSHIIGKYTLEMPSSGLSENSILLFKYMLEHKHKSFHIPKETNRLQDLNVLLFKVDYVEVDHLFSSLRTYRRSVKELRDNCLIYIHNYHGYLFNYDKVKFNVPSHNTNLKRAYGKLRKKAVPPLPPHLK